MGRKRRKTVEEIVNRVIDAGFECEQYDDDLTMVHFYHYIPLNDNEEDDYIVEMSYLVSDLVTNTVTDEIIIDEMKRYTSAVYRSLGMNVNVTVH